MFLLIDGYNLLHSGRTPIRLNGTQLQWERDRLIDQLSVYRQTKPIEIIVVFDGWQAGWTTEKRERRKGIEIIFSKIGEKADEVLKRLIKEKGAGAIVISSDHEISKYANKFSVPVISSEQFQEKLGRSENGIRKEFLKDNGEEDDELRGMKKKGASRKLSKKEKRLRIALKKL